MQTQDFHRIAELGATMADETRVRLLCFLLDSPATTSELVARTGLDQPRVSAHLAALRRNNLVSVSVSGRQHVYTIKSPAITNAIRSFIHVASLSTSGPPLRPSRISSSALREVGEDSPLRRARTCYDHLAGVAGVELLDEIQRRGWVRESKMQGERRRTVFNLTEKGSRSLRRLNVSPEVVRGSKRLFAYGCLDWTERRYHLGGSLGKAILESLISEHVVERTGQRSHSRALTLRKPILQWINTH